jgi:hypothetical protein
MIVSALSLLLLLAGTTLSASRQVEIHRLQAVVAQEQSNYASAVSRLTGVAAPGRVATQAGKLHLVVPTQVTQIVAVPLDRPLPPRTSRPSELVDGESGAAGRLI